MKKFLIFLLVTLLSVTALAQLKVSANKRFLVDNTNTPVFISGDAGWSLFAQLTIPNAKVYIDGRASYKFNAVIANLIEHQFANNAPNNAYGTSPWAGRAFAQPNNAYFAVADSIIAYAQSKGVYIFLDPLYLGYSCGSEGWCAEVQTATSADMTAWGTYVGNRYKGFTNIVWLIGGDTNPSSGVKSKVETFVAALLTADPNHICTAHQAPEYNANEVWTSSWLAVNNVYTYSNTLYSNSQRAYASTPIRPFFMIESAYENEHSSTPQQVRAEGYWAVLSGGCGEFFGNLPMWNFGAGWQTNLTSTGSVSMKNLANLFRSRNWWNLKPDFTNTLIKTGAGSSTSYATAELASDSSSIIAYLPTSRAITLNTSGLHDANVNVYWFNPSNGAVVTVGTSPKGNLSLTPPSAGDWVLVADAPSFNFPLPGFAVAPTPIVAGTFTGTPTNLSAAGSVTLAWTSQNATTATISGIGSVALSGSTSVLVDSTKTFVLTLSDGKTTATYSVTITISVPIAPGVPTLSIPTNGTTNVALAPTLTWVAVSGATKYKAQVATDTLFTIIIVNDSALTSASKSLTGLKSLTKYFWRVSAGNTVGWGAFSLVRSFTTLDTTAPPPVTNAVNIYVDGLVSPWLTVRSWSATIASSTTAPVYAGTSSLKITASPWASIQFSKGTWGAFQSIDPTGFASLSFMLYGTKAGTIAVSVVNTTNTNQKTPVSVSITANTWTTITIPMASLATAPFTAIALGIAGTATTFVIDNMQFVPIVAPPLPIQLYGFTGVAASNGVKLEWKTLSEINNYGFFVQRKAESDTNYISVPNGFISGHGTTLTSQTYEFTDVVVPTVDYLYRLKQVDMDGTEYVLEPIHFAAVTSVEEGTITHSFVLRQNYPNPFNPSTTIYYQVARTNYVSIIVYDTQGKEIETLVRDIKTPGGYEVRFDARSLSSGVYFVRLVSSDYAKTIKINLLK